MSAAALTAILALVGEALNLVPTFIADLKALIAAFEGQQTATHTSIAPEVITETQAAYDALKAAEKK